MSAITLSGNAQLVSATSLLIKMRVDNPQLVEISVGIHASNKVFSGKYNPTQAAGSAMIAQTEFNTLGDVLKNNATIQVSFSYEDTNNSAIQLCFAGTCVPQTVSLNAARDTVAPISAVSGSAGAAATGTE